MKSKMKKFFTLNVREHSGFTLVELIVVIAILAILAGVAVPAYSGYVKKANKVADESLLKVINDAFAAACIEEGIDQSKLTSAAIILGDDGKVRNVKVGDANFKAFWDYYAGNDDAAFVVYTAVYFDTTLHIFCFSTLKLSYTQEQIDALRSSAYAKLGGAALAERLAYLSNLAGSDGLKLVDSAGEDYENAFYAYFGIDPDADEADVQLEAKLSELTMGMSGDEEDEFYKKLYNNAVVLYAAQCSATQDITVKTLKNYLSGSDFSSAEGIENNGETLATVSAIYGLYMAYDSSVTDPLEVLGKAQKGAQSEDEGSFGEWLAKDGESNLSAYLEAMKIINETAKDSDAATDILINGFTDDELLALMQQILGN